MPGDTSHGYKANNKECFQASYIEHELYQLWGYRYKLFS